MTAMRYQTLIHIGCGAQPDLAAYRRLADQMWLIEADADAVAALEPLVQDDAQLHLRHAVVDVSGRVAPFYRYSLPWANGLEALDQATQRLYPSLRCLTDDEVKTEAVDALVSACLGQAANASLGAAEESGAGEAHLLILDVGRHNAALLQALEHGGMLAHFTTVVVVPAHRREAPVDVPHSLCGQVKAPVGLVLPDHAQILMRHPLLQLLQRAQAQLDSLTAAHQRLTAARDARAHETAALTTERDALAQAKQTLAAERDQLIQAKAAADQFAAEHRTQLEALTAQREQLTAARDMLALEKAALITERDVLACAKQTLTAERDQLAQAKAAADQLAAERQTQLEALTAQRQQLTAASDVLAQEKAALTTERDVLAQAKQSLSAERDQLVQANAAADQLGAERQTQLAALTAQPQQLTAARDAPAQETAALTAERDTLKRAISEGQQRKMLLEDKLIKAEAQIELIKDLLLRESELYGRRV